MKKILLTLLLAVLFTSVNAQVYKYKTNAVSIRYKQEDNSWSKWSDWSETDVLIFINVKTLKITIYSKKTQEYHIIEYEGKEIDKDGDEVVSILCVDGDGNKCRLKKIKYQDGTGTQMYIQYADMMWVYDVYEIE